MFLKLLKKPEKSTPPKSKPSGTLMPDISLAVKSFATVTPFTLRKSKSYGLSLSSKFE